MATKHIFFAVMLLLKLPAVVSAQTTTRPADPEKWELVWSDDFQYTGLPDPKKWGYEEGFVRNKESQYYTVKRKENARVENGELIIEARREEFPNPRYDENGKSWQTKTKSAQYTSASLNTLDKASWKYGRFIIIAKVPGVGGSWPAFWMLGNNVKQVGWPKCGEIDVMEWFTPKPDMVKGSVIFNNTKGKYQSVSLDHKTATAPADAFHTYETRWYPDRIEIYVDDVKYNTLHIDDAGGGSANPFRQPMYLLVNLAMGSNSGKIDDSKLPAKYEVKYVKVYQLAKADKK